MKDKLRLVRTTLVIKLARNQVHEGEDSHLVDMPNQILVGHGYNDT